MEENKHQVQGVLSFDKETNTIKIKMPNKKEVSNETNIQTESSLEVSTGISMDGIIRINWMEFYGILSKLNNDISIQERKIQEQQQHLEAMKSTVSSIYTLMKKYQKG